MTAPFTVRLRTAKRDMHVTSQVMDVSYRTVAPGGYASASLTLERPLSFTPDELAYYGKLYIYDGRNARTLWEGRVEDLGRGSDENGQVWSVNAVGPMAHAQDQTVPLLYQVTDLTSWQEDHDGPAWMDRNTIQTTGFGPGLQMHVPRDVNVGIGYYQGWINLLFSDNNINVAQVSFHYGQDVSNADWHWQFFTDFSHTFAAGSSANISYTVGIDYAGAFTLPQFGLKRTTSGIIVADDVTTASFTNITMRSTLYSVAGFEDLTSTPYSGVPLQATGVVADLLGRLLPLFDGVNATIDTSQNFTFAGQFAYPDGATAAQVLDDLMTLLPGMYWTAGPTNPATGLWSFAWKPWPTTVRYEATAEGGFSSPSSAEGIYDTVSVRWIDPSGNPQTTIRTLANPILDAAGFHRSTRIDLGSSVAGGVEAAQAGDQFLAQNAVPQSAGTLTVTKRVLDRLNGWMVDPWEIEPGYLIRVRNVAPTASSTSNRDGVTTFRVVATNVDQGDASATLELDAPAISVSSLFAAMQARQSYSLRS